jgi:hypothetical protein
MAVTGAFTEPEIAVEARRIQSQTQAWETCGVKSRLSVPTDCIQKSCSHVWVLIVSSSPF